MKKNLPRKINLQAEPDQRESAQQWGRVWFASTAKRTIRYAMIGVIFLALIQLELDNRWLHQELIKQRATNEAFVGDYDLVRQQLGDLSLRFAQLEFEVDDPHGAGFIDVETALQIAVQAVETPPGAQPFQLEDAKYLYDAMQLNPSFPTGPAWQFTLQVQEGHFIVIVTALNGKIILINKMN